MNAIGGNYRIRVLEPAFWRPLSEVQFIGDLPRMQICGGWERGVFRFGRVCPAFRQIATQPRLCTDTALHSFSAACAFVSGDQTVAAAMLGAHDISFKFLFEVLQPISCRGRL